VGLEYVGEFGCQLNDAAKCPIFHGEKLFSSRETTSGSLLKRNSVFAETLKMRLDTMVTKLGIGLGQ
jgi:hypothetical protein